MIVTKLKITNLRAIEAAEFTFQPGFNLIVGVNGVGKTSVLDALRICFSRILPSITPSKAKAMSFQIEDIRNGFPLLDVSMQLDINEEEFRFTRRQWREKVAQDDPENLDRLRRSILETERLRDSARNLLRDLDRPQGLEDTDNYAPDKSKLVNAAKTLKHLPICVFYSTNRSVVSMSSSTGRAVGGPSAAYADALVPRSWNIRNLSNWMRVQTALKSESPIASQHLNTLRSVVSQFLPEFDGFREGDEETGTLLVNKAGNALDVRQLSDGERGILAMALDLGRRLSQANPSVEDPIKDGQAIVLIDEIDLHLHPKWQREIVHNLCAAFPNCQFIATTHSPQIIGEVEHERIQIISDGQVYLPPYSFGVDSNRVLEGIMEADNRTSDVKELLSEISDLIGEGQFDRSRELLSELVKMLRRDDDPEITRLLTLLDFLEGKE